MRDRVIRYKTVDEEEVLSAMEVYDKDPVNMDKLITEEDKQAIENSIEQQALESGFAEEAANYLAAMALETDSFTRVADDYNLTGYAITDEDGQAMDIQAMSPRLKAAKANGAVDVELSDVRAKLSTKLKHFSGLSGLRVDLGIDVTVSIKTPDGKGIKILLKASFEQEVRIDLDVSGKAVWKKAWIFPYIDDYKATVSVDLYDYTGLFVTATLSTGDGAAEDIGKQMEELMKTGGGKDAAEKMQEQYKSMIETTSEMADLFTQPLFYQRFNVALIFTVKINVDFVVSADVKISLGCSFTYENAKRYTYTIHVFAGSVTSDTTNLVNEKYEFYFYAMGTIHLRMGIRVKINVALICDAVANVGITAEAGAYAKLWGYFYYDLKWESGKGKTQKYAGGAVDRNRRIPGNQAKRLGHRRHIQL